MNNIKNPKNEKERSGLALTPLHSFYQTSCRDGNPTGLFAAKRARERESFSAQEGACKKNHLKKKKTHKLDLITKEKQC